MPPDPQGDPTLRLALAQTAFAPTSVGEAIDAVGRLAAEAAERGATFLMLPETFLSGYGDETAARALSLSSKEAYRALAPIATANRLDLLAGYSEREDDLLFNSALLVSSIGEILLNYRKMHLWGSFERRIYGQGVPAPTVRLSVGMSVGVLICFDLEFAAAAQDLVRRGADLVAVISATSLPYEIVPRSLVPARAYENAAFVAFCNRVGEHHGAQYVGLSCVAAPDGSMLARAAADEEALVVADIDPDRFAPYIRKHRYHTLQRTDIFPLRPLDGGS